MAASGVQELWKTEIEPNVIQILSGSGPSTYATHSAVYSAGYNYIMRGRNNADHLRDLYAEVESFFTGYPNEINAVSTRTYWNTTPPLSQLQAAPNDDTELPTYYDTQWGHFSRGVSVVDRLLDYLNKHYGRRKNVKGNKDVMTVKNLALRSWKVNVLESLSPRLGGTEAGKACLEEAQGILTAEEPKAEKSPRYAFS